MRPLLALALVVSFVSSSYAQLFPNLRWSTTKQVGASNCPGGVCPTVATVATAPLRAINTRAGHWSYPGDIDSHLEGTHGVATAGMTRQQKLDLHDALHEGTATQSVVPKYRPAASGGGSSGTIRGYGSSGSSFGVGTVFADGAVVVSVGPVADPVPSMAAEVSAARKSDFRKAFLKAAKEARDKGDITPLQHGRLVVTAMRPRELANIQAWVHENAIQEGMATTQSPDWDALLEFLEKLIPLIIQLIDLFS